MVQSTGQYVAARYADEAFLFLISCRLILTLSECGTPAGFGFSDKPRGLTPSPYSIYTYADVVESLLEHLEVSAVHVLAHDIGDTVAQELLARHISRRTEGGLTGRMPSLSFILYGTLSRMPLACCTIPGNFLDLCSCSEQNPLLAPQALMFSQRCPRACIGGADGLDFLSMAFLNGGLIPGLHRPVLSMRLLHNKYIGPWLGPLFTFSRFSASMSPIFGPSTKPSRGFLQDSYSALTFNGGNLIMHK